MNVEGNKLVFNVEARLNHLMSCDENTNVKLKESVINKIDMNQTGQLSPGCTHLLGRPDDNSTDPWTSRDAKKHKSNSEDGNGVCVFCHSSEVSDEIGKMLHCANGKEVAGDVKRISNGMHVHQICIDWTPQVYYEGDNIRNLESELARASKLKCQAIYQVPQQANFLSAAPSGAKEWVLCESVLSTQEKSYLDKFANSYRATVSKYWTPNVTHVIAAVDDNGAYTRTPKVLQAILNGKWIVTMDWIRACDQANKLVDEEPYEAGLDKHGCHDGPKTGR